MLLIASIVYSSWEL